jgi:hypothetical protein
VREEIEGGGGEKERETDRGMDTVREKVDR